LEAHSMTRLPPGGVLALDLSRVVGWCYGRLDDVNPTFGRWILPSQGGEGGRYSALEKELGDAMEAWGPGQVILEAPLSFQALIGVSTAKVMQQQYTLRGIAYMLAWQFSTPIQEIDSYSVRSDVLGRGRFAPKTVKAEVVAYCRRRGWAVHDDNEADACLTWVWLVDRLRHRRPAAGPLFATIGSGR
jgi:hypothetical protein